MTLHCYDLLFPDFCQLAILRISYGELKGVFRKEADTMVLDVYLPDGGQAPGSWQGQIHVVDGDLIGALEKLHRSRVLDQYRVMREQSRQSGLPLGGTIMFLAKHYRTANSDDLYASIDKVLASPLRIYKGSPVAHEVYEFDWLGDVSVSLVPHLKQLIGKDEHGEPLAPLTLATIDRETILVALIDVLAKQNVRVIGQTQIALAA